LQAKPRPGKQPIYTKATDKRILKLLDKPALQGFGAKPAVCWPRRSAMLTSSMSGGSAQPTKLTSRLASPGARAATRTLRSKPSMLLASTSPRPPRPRARQSIEKIDELQYLDIVDAQTLEPVTSRLSRPVAICVAGYVGSTQLIDNVVLDGDAG
jgi:Pantoate-beta-alanine ligase